MTTPAPLDQTPEERDLAQRLSRLGPRGEPSPQLDARVLAAAREALDAPVVPARHSHRWPVALGLAASLVLAVGVAWRLRPLPPGSTAAMVPPTQPAAPAHRSPPAPAAAAAVAQTPPARVPGVTAGSSTAQEAAPRRAAKADASPSPDVQVIVDVPSPAPPPPPPASDEDQGSADAAAGATDANALDRAAAADTDTQSDAGDEPLDAMPPATADAPGVRDAWLSRIRALLDSGDVTGGRRSLHAFVERYPDYPLPEDLRALQQ